MALTVANYVLHAPSGGKFVVLLRTDDPDSGILAVSDFSRDFQHHDIVVRWQERNETTLAAANLRVAGGGWWKLENELLIFYGQSAAYGRFDPSWLRPRLSPGMVLTESAIDVR